MIVVGWECMIWESIIRPLYHLPRFWWRDCSKLFPDFKQLLVFFCPRNENSIVIWQGAWLKDINILFSSLLTFQK
jgi:hypothetical protein